MRYHWVFPASFCNQKAIVVQVKEFNKAALSESEDNSENFYLRLFRQRNIKRVV